MHSVGQFWQVVNRDVLGCAETVESYGCVWLLPDAVVIELYDIGSISDVGLGFLEESLLYTQDEAHGDVCTIQELLW